MTYTIECPSKGVVKSCSSLWTAKQIAFLLWDVYECQVLIYRDPSITPIADIDADGFTLREVAL